MIIDVHAHLINSSNGNPVDEILSIADKLGITIVFLMPFRALFRREIFMDNLRVIEAYRRHPKRIIPFVTVDPWLGEEAVKQLKMFIALGAKGLKLHPLTQGLPAHSEILYPLIEIAEKEKILILFHTGSPIYAQPLQILELASIYTKAKFILAHMGLGKLWYDAIRAAKKADNIYLDTAGQRYIPVIRLAVKEIGSTKILFGSDMPFLSPEIELEKIFQCRFPQNILEDILYKNALLLIKSMRRPQI